MKYTINYLVRNDEKSESYGVTVYAPDMEKAQQIVSAIFFINGDNVLSIHIKKQ